MAPDFFLRRLLLPRRMRRMQKKTRMAKMTSPATMTPARSPIFCR